MAKKLDELITQAMSAVHDISSVAVRVLPRYNFICAVVMSIAMWIAWAGDPEERSELFRRIRALQDRAPRNDLDRYETLTWITRLIQVQWQHHYPHDIDIFSETTVYAIARCAELSYSSERDYLEDLKTPEDIIAVIEKKGGVWSVYSCWKFINKATSMTVDAEELIEPANATYSSIVNLCSGRTLDFYVSSLQTAKTEYTQLNRSIEQITVIVEHARTLGRPKDVEKSVNEAKEKLYDAKNRLAALHKVQEIITTREQDLKKPAIEEIAEVVEGGGGTPKSFGTNRAGTMVHQHPRSKLDDLLDQAAKSRVPLTTALLVVAQACLKKGTAGKASINYDGTTVTLSAAGRKTVSVTF